ncbi:HD domain-containing protein [Candidatus Woesearchaeota archaeon]|nr:HD domain-containing protein [Candidatus Woesearchaeota archaeon]
MALPTRKESFELLWHHNVPQNIIRHSIAVSRLAADIGARLKAEGKKIDLNLLDRACILHDIGKLAAIQSGGSHGEVGYSILLKHGYREVAEVIRKHPLHCILDSKSRPKAWEEKILYYCDKRVREHRVVSLRERLADLKKRYPQYREGIRRAEPLVYRLEMELLGKK